jgi:phosphatidylglycerophosphate synthase
LRAAERHEIALLDTAEQPSYVMSMRRAIRPIWFPPPSHANIPLAERLVLDTAQNGTLDLPAMMHAPIETWIIARLCRTSVTPNQITLFTAIVSASVAALFATAHLAAGTILALIVGVLDGLDGKQARVKVETTPLGQREHALDYALELSWWIALAFCFGAYRSLALLIASDLIDRFAKKRAKQHTGRNLDDVAPIDRFVRLIGGRRNIYVWIFGAGLLLHAADKAFVALCGWGAVTAAIHVSRAVWISWQGSGPRTEGAPH